jgi:hypothetical protein
MAIMKPEKVYQELRDLADKLGVAVEEHNFRNAGIRVKSGFCVVHGKKIVIIDKHRSLGKKIRVLASALSKLPIEDVFMLPALREVISRYAEE